MQSAQLSRPVKSYHPVSKSNRNTPFEQNESLEDNKFNPTWDSKWSWKHPNIAAHFFGKIEPPLDVEDAFVRRATHQHAADDCTLQLERNRIEHDLCLDNKGCTDDEGARKIAFLNHQAISLYKAKRFHQNASHAYWYFMIKEDKLSTK